MQSKSIYTSTHMSTHMGSTNISIRDEAYIRLKHLMRTGESFSDVIIRVTDTKAPADGRALLRFAGILRDKDIDWEERERHMQELRSSFNKRLRGRMHDRA